MGNTATSRTIKNGLGRAIVFVLAFLYVAAVCQFDLVHQFVHEHGPVASHTVEDEKDLCHRVIYHNETDQNCGHHAHLTVSDKCEMCDLACPGDHHFLAEVEAAHAKIFGDHFTRFRNGLDSHCAVISSSRAPPVEA